MHMRRLMLAVGLVAVAACSSSDITNPNTIAADLRGMWTETGLVVGSSRIFLLQVTGTTVTGEGSYSGEAGPVGSLTVTGSITGMLITLDIAQDNGVTVHVKARLASPRTLSGSQFIAGDSTAAMFQKLQSDPPGA